MDASVQLWIIIALAGAREAAELTIIAPTKRAEVKAADLAVLKLDIVFLHLADLTGFKKAPVTLF